MLINSQHHIELFKKLAEVINAYASQGVKIERVEVASALDQQSWVAAWGNTTWTIEDIRTGTANFDIMEKLAEHNVRLDNEQQR